MTKKRITVKKIKKMVVRIKKAAKCIAGGVRQTIAEIRVRLSSLKRLFGRVALLLLVSAIVYGASGIVYVPSNAHLYLKLQSSERFTYWQPYSFAEGIWWIQPGLARELQITNSDIPATDNLLAMALYYDQEFDSLILAGKLGNPRTDAEFEAMADVIVAYLRTMEGPVFQNFEFNGVSFFVPDRNTPSKYDVDMAHWSRIAVDEGGAALKDANGRFVNDNSIYVNHQMLAETIREGDRSLFGMMTHELVHGALSITIPPTGEGYFDQETLTQVVTTHALYGMAQQGIPGADTAFAEHMRDMALFSAKYRAYFNDDMVYPSYYGNVAAGADINTEADRLANLPTTWEPPRHQAVVRDNLGTMVEILKGNPYANEYKVNLDPFPIMDWAKQNIMLIKQNGIHIRPYTILREAIGYHKWWGDIGRTIFGRDFVYWEWVPITGEIERYDAIQMQIIGREPSPEYQEKWDGNNAYFADAWFRYSYGPLMTIIGSVNYGIPIYWYGMNTSDFNTLIMMYAGTISPTDIFVTRSIDFDPASWNGRLWSLGLKHYVLPEDGLCIRVINTGPCVAKDIGSLAYGTVRPFPSIPLAFGLLLILDVMALRKWGTRRDLARRTAWRTLPFFYIPAGFAGSVVVRMAKAAKTWRKRNK